MNTPTLDLTDRPEPGSCRCRPWSLCAKCARDLQLFRYEAEIAQWLRVFGTEPDPRAPRRQGKG
jgi:hypothetical protein